MTNSKTILIMLALAAHSAAGCFAQAVVSGFAGISVCDVPGSSQVVVTGDHIVTEEEASPGHTHAGVVVQGVISDYAFEDRCFQDFGGTTVATCSNSSPEVNGSAGCTTQSGGSCSRTFLSKTLPKHNPAGGAGTGGTAFSNCQGGDCIGDPGCSPFGGLCF